MNSHFDGKNKSVHSLRVFLPKLPIGRVLFFILRSLLALLFVFVTLLTLSSFISRVIYFSDSLDPEEVF